MHSASKLTALHFSAKSWSPLTLDLLTTSFHIQFCGEPDPVIFNTLPPHFVLPRNYSKDWGFFNEYGFDEPRAVNFSPYWKDEPREKGQEHITHLIKIKREVRLTLFGWPELWSMWILTEFPSKLLLGVEKKIKVLNKEGWEKQATPGPLWCTYSKTIHSETICSAAKHVSCNTIHESKQIMPMLRSRTWNKASHPKPTPASDRDWGKVGNAK